MLLKKLLPLYEKYGTILVILGWSIITIIAFLYSYITHNLERPYYLIFSLFGWLAILLYFGCRKYFTKSNAAGCVQSDDKIHKNNNHMIVSRLVGIVYYILTCILLLILQFCETRPIIYYILITFLLAILVMSILQNISKIDTYKNIIRIIFFSALSSMSVFKMHYLSGLTDVGYFAALNELTAVLGNIPEIIAGKQLLYPLNHLIIAASQILTSSDIKLATICAVIIPSILISIVLFVITRHYIGDKYALISMLICTIIAEVIYFRYQANPTEWAWVYFLILLFSIYLWKRTTDKTRYIFFGFVILSSLLVIFSHQFGSFTVVALVIGLYLASVLIDGKVFTKMVIPVVSYIILLFGVWFANSGINKVIKTMDSGISNTVDKINNQTPTVPIDVQPTPTVSVESLPTTESEDVITTTIGAKSYVGIEPQSILGFILNETCIILIQCIVLILPLLLLAVKMKYASKIEKSFIWAIIGTIICGLCFFYGIYIFYTPMSIRIGIYLAIPFAIGLSFIFYSFSKFAKTKQKRIVHGCFILIIMCVIGFVNIGAPMINDDNCMWNKEYTITSEWSYKDVEASDTVVTNLPETFTLFTDWAATYPLLYQTYKKVYIDMKKCHNVVSYPKILLKWDTNEYLPGAFILFREKMLISPNRSVERNGSNELKDIISIGYIDNNYKKKLDGRGNKIYNVGSDTLYCIC